MYKKLFLLDENLLFLFNLIEYKLLLFTNFFKLLFLKTRSNIPIKIMGDDIGNRPLLMFALILGIAGVQLFSFGLLSELLIRTYHESQSRPIYRIRSISSANKN